MKGVRKASQLHQDFLANQPFCTQDTEKLNAEWGEKGGSKEKEGESRK